MQKVLLTIFVIKNAPLELDEDHEVANPPVLLQKSFETNFQTTSNSIPSFSFAISDVVKFESMSANLYFDINGELHQKGPYLSISVSDGTSKYDGVNSIRAFLKFPSKTFDSTEVVVDANQEKKSAFFSQLQFVFKINEV